MGGNRIIDDDHLFALQLCAANVSRVDSGRSDGVYRCWCHMTIVDAPADTNGLHTGLCHNLQRVMKSYDAGEHPNDSDD